MTEEEESEISSVVKRLLNDSLDRAEQSQDSRTYPDRAGADPFG